MEWGCVQGGRRLGMRFSSISEVCMCIRLCLASFSFITGLSSAPSLSFCSFQTFLRCFNISNTRTSCLVYKVTCENFWSGNTITFRSLFIGYGGGMRWGMQLLMTNDVFATLGIMSPLIPLVLKRSTSSSKFC